MSLIIEPKGPRMHHTDIKAAHERQQLADMVQGTKNDTTKAPLHLIPPEFMFAIAEILRFGAEKYAPRNWEKGINYSRVYRACLGHLGLWFMRRPRDPETGRSHLWHAACCIMFLVVYELREMKAFDDRPEIYELPALAEVNSDISLGHDPEG